MFALNFQSPHHEKLLIARTKNCTVRLGDVRNIYPENSVVWISVGKRMGPKRKLYAASVDRTKTKRFSQLTMEDLQHQNPDIDSVEALLRFFESIYNKALTMEDLVTVIYFSEITEA